MIRSMISALAATVLFACCYAVVVSPRDIIVDESSLTIQIHANLPSTFNATVDGYATAIENLLTENGYSQAASDIANFSAILKNSFADSVLTMDDQNQLKASLALLVNDFSNITGVAVPANANVTAIVLGAITSLQNVNPVLVNQTVLPLLASLITALSGQTVTADQLRGLLLAVESFVTSASASNTIPSNVPPLPTSLPTVVASASNAPQVVRKETVLRRHPVDRT